MLGKIFKHDMKASAKYFIPMYIGFIGIVAFSKIIFSIYSSVSESNKVLDILTTVAATTSTFAFIGMIFATFAFIIIYFYRKCVSVEGYLTFTLPVKTSTHIISKILLGVIWQIITYILVLLGGIIFTINHDISELFAELSLFFSDIFRFGYELVCFEVLLSCLLAMIIGVLMFYASLSIGQLFSKHKVAASVGAFFIMYIIIQIFGSVTLISVGIPTYSAPLVSMNFLSLSQNFLLIFIIGELILGIVFYFITHYLINKKLNLE